MQGWEGSSGFAARGPRMAERRQVSGVLQCGSGDTAGKGRDSEAERLKGGTYRCLLPAGGFVTR